MTTDNFLLFLINTFVYFFTKTSFTMPNITFVHHSGNDQLSITENSKIADSSFFRRFLKKVFI